ncbi:MAG: hypothetical protein ACRDVP_03785 [Acidimicrobiales bacterium]
MRVRRAPVGASWQRMAGPGALVQGLIAILVIAAPTLAVEEDWHGRPMIDQSGHLWVVPTIIVAAAFCIGGAIGSRKARGLGVSLLHGVVVGIISAGLLVGADVARRAIVHESFSPGVNRLWLQAAALSIVVAALGAGLLWALTDRSARGLPPPVGRVDQGRHHVAGVDGIDGGARRHNNIDRI